MNEQQQEAETTAARTVTIDHLGGGGDGVALVGDERWFVAGALAGEEVVARPGTRNRNGVHADIERIVQPAAERVTPPCRHFADTAAPCGGCNLQHLAAEPYRAFKRDLIVHALQHRGLAADAELVAPTLASPAHSRRRVILTAIGTHDGAVLGFHQRRSRRVVDIAECVIAVPAITAALPELRTVLGAYLHAGERAGVTVVATDSGLSIELAGPKRYPRRSLRERLTALAESVDACRIVWQPGGGKPVTVLVDRRPALQYFAGVPVELPYGAFLQATADGEAAIRDQVLAAVGEGEGRALADLYTGSGSLALPLAVAGHAVRAVDHERAGLRALKRASAAADLDLKTLQHDLSTGGPRGLDWNQLEAVVFDPPRAGARAIAGELARSEVPTVVAVSCHPGTFARDARMLVDGDYVLTSVQPIDQFVYSSHVELVAVFRRG